MILKTPRLLARWSGLLVGVEQNSRWYFVATVLTILNTANFVIPIGTFMVQNLDNLDDFTDAFGAFCNMTVNMLKTCMFLLENRNLKRILEHMEKFALNQSLSNYKHSCRAEAHGESHVKKFLVVVYLAVFGITSAPLLAMLIEYWKTGQVVDTRWNMPFKIA